jgi:hypothetical protein
LKKLIKHSFEKNEFGDHGEVLCDTVTSQVRTPAVIVDLLVWFLLRSRVREKFRATRMWKMQLEGYEQLRLTKKKRGPHNEDQELKSNRYSYRRVGR